MKKYDVAVVEINRGIVEINSANYLFQAIVDDIV